MPCPRPYPQHEVQQVVGHLLARAEPTTAPGPVRLVEDHGAVPAVEQVGAFGRVVKDEARRHDGDLCRTTRYVLGSAGAYLVATMVQPDLLRRGPDCARDTELVVQLRLPLEGQRGRAEDQHGTVLQQRGY